jgi:hypothetical protein
MLWTVAGLSWLLSTRMLYRVWRGSDDIWSKVGLSVLLMFPVLGPFFCAWILGFPPSQDADLQEHGAFHGAFLWRWRDRLERSGRLPKLVRLKDWGKRR